MDVVAWILGIVGGLGILGSIGVLVALRNEQHRRLESAVRVHIGGHGAWAGAWLWLLPAPEANRARTEAEQRAAQQDPAQVLEIWENFGGRLVGHIPGPELITEAEACGWLEHASNALVLAPVPRPPGPDSHVFALVYASTTPPPLDTARANAVASFLRGPGVLGVAFVACARPEEDATAGRRQMAILGLTAAGVFALGALIVGIVDFYTPRSAPQSNPNINPPAKSSQPRSNVRPPR